MLDDKDLRRGKKCYQQNSSLLKSVLEWNCSKIDELSIFIPKKKQPLLPEKIHQKLYGIPGQNIFTYDLDKPKPRKTILPQIDDGMVPKEDSNTVSKSITRINIAFKDSLEKSLMPRESSEIKLIGRTILNRDHISHLKNDLLNMEEPKNIIKPRIGANLITVPNKISRRKQFKKQREIQLNGSDETFSSCEDQPNTSESNLNQLST